MLSIFVLIFFRLLSTKSGQNVQNCYFTIQFDLPNVKSYKEREIRLKDRFSRAFVWDLDLQILLTSRLALHNKREFVAYFAKRQEIRVFIKRPRREKSRESPGQINPSCVFLFS